MAELATYLSDHYAGATGGASLIKQLAEGSDTAAERKTLEKISAEIESERPKLRDIMDSVGASPSRVKQLGAWTGEKAGRGKLRSSCEAGRVLQFEAMIMGVTGKLQLWRSLIELAPTQSELKVTQLRTLARQAESQRARLEKLHARAAKKLSG